MRYPLPQSSTEDDTVSMATATTIPVSEYLSTSYRPDCDYIDGVLKERNVGEISHSFLQSILVALFNRNSRQWQVVAGTELRIRIAPQRFRIPDVCVKRRSDPSDPVLRVAPLICVEVLSPSDSLTSMQERFDDYFLMGVEHVWLVDPIRRRGFVASRTGIEETPGGEFAIANSPVRVLLHEVFTELDDMLSEV